jgi:hypothetical protein
MRRQTVAATFVAALFPGLASSQVPVGPEFQVNSYTTGIQASPRIASDAAGNFVATWFSIGQDESSYGAFARRYDVSGTPVGPGEFRLNTFTLGIQSRPAVAAAPDGRLSFAWHTDNQDGSGLAIYSRLFDAAGAPTGGEFRVNTYTTGHQSLPRSVRMQAGTSSSYGPTTASRTGAAEECSGRDSTASERLRVPSSG